MLCDTTHNLLYVLKLDLPPVQSCKQRSIQKVDKAGLHRDWRDDFWQHNCGGLLWLSQLAKAEGVGRVPSFAVVRCQYWDAVYTVLREVGAWVSAHYLVLLRAGNQFCDRDSRKVLHRNPDGGR